MRMNWFQFQIIVFYHKNTRTGVTLEIVTLKTEAMKWKILVRFANEVCSVMQRGKSTVAVITSLHSALHKYG